MLRRRVLFLVTEDWYFLSHRLPMARAARDAGYEVHVATRLSGGRAAIEAEDFTLHPMSWQRGSLSPSGNAASILHLKSLLKRLAPDVLHNVAMKPVLLGSLASMGLKNTVLVNSIAGMGSAFLAQSLAKRFFARLISQTLRYLMNREHVRVLVQNPDDWGRFREIGVKEQNLVLIPGSGVDTTFLQPTPEPEGPVTLAFVGRMIEDKGIRTLMEAHAKLSERKAAPQLLLAGTPDPDNPTSISEQELKSWDAREGVQWLGQISDVPAMWRRAHIAVLPSRREGLPKSLLEAAAAGRPMIATDAPGCREIAIEGRTALTHPVDDADALAAAIERMASDAEMRRGFAREARRLAEEKFSSAAIGAATVALYNEMVTRDRLR